MDAEPAPEIVIVAPRLPDAAGERAYSSVVIDPADIEAAGRLDDALRTTPGVSLFRRNDSATANPTIQGLSVRASAPSGAGRVLVTLDGAPMNDPFGGSVIWGGLPPETISNARIVRGAGAGSYGAGALTGTVSLSERRGEGASFAGEVGEHGAWRASAIGEARDDAFSLMLAATSSASDGWVPVRDGRGAADEALWSDNSAGVARIEWRDGERLFSLRLGGYSESRGAGLVGADSTAEGASLSATLAAPDGPFAWRLQAWALSSDLYNASVTTAPDRSTTTPANTQYATPALGWGANAALRWTHENGGVELGADVRAADGETRELFLFTGGAFTRNRVAGGKTRTAGVYAEAWRESGPWLFSGGVRTDVTRAYDGLRVERIIATNAPVLQLAPVDSETVAPTARFGVRRALGEMYVRGAAYAGFRPPTLNELHRPFRVGNDVTEAYAALEPERLHGADLAFGGQGWSIGVFATRLEDAIVNVTLGAGPGTFPPGVFVPAGGAYRQRQNAGVIDAAGVEADAHGEYGALSWRAALNYTHARIDGLRPTQSPEWSATLGFDWRLSGRTSVGADLAYESERFEDDLNTRVLGAATILNVRVEHALTPRLALYAAVDNALDAEIETAETAGGIESFGPPRALRLGFRLHSH